MILGHIIGKVTTTEFSFQLDAEVKKFDYVQVHEEGSGWVLCQVLDIEKSKEGTVAFCLVIGYRDENGRIAQPRVPFEHGSEVLYAEDDFIRKVIEQKDTGAYIGKLQGKDVKIHIELGKVLTKHVAVLAKSGSGKSYAVGVLLEEIAQRKIPVLVIDPHGEYGMMRQKNNEERSLMSAFGIKPQSFPVREYADATLVRDAIPLKLSAELTSGDVADLFPGKLNATQLGILYNCIGTTQRTTLPQLLLALEAEENNAKWTLISTLQHVYGLGIFSLDHTPYNEMLLPGTITTVNLKGYAPEMQELIVHKLCSDLFEMRKKSQVSPFFLVVEEAHNFCPERNFGEAVSSRILRTIASEGRKFGLGLCVISQRPARVEKSVLSQCSTNIILKVTNPNDLKAVSSSVEGLTAHVEREIQNLPIGTAIITGIADIPLFVTVRPRKSFHGGRGITLDGEELNIVKDAKEFAKEELLPLIKPKLELDVVAKKKAKTVLVPCAVFNCEEAGKKYDLVVDLTSGRLVTNVDSFTTKEIPDLSGLEKDDLVLLAQCHKSGPLEKRLASKKSVDRLLERNLLVEKDGMVSISDDHVFTKLVNFRAGREAEPSKVSYDEKKDEQYGRMAARNKLAAFTSILNDKDCYVVKYE